MRRWPLALTVLALVGCGGQPDTVEEEAEAVGSIAAEGSLLAHDAAEGSTLRTFTAEHAHALRRKLVELDPALHDPRLERISVDVDRALGRLEHAPGDRSGAARIENRLDRLSKASEEIGKTA